MRVQPRQEQVNELLQEHFADKLPSRPSSQDFTRSAHGHGKDDSTKTDAPTGPNSRRNNPAANSQVAGWRGGYGPIDFPVIAATALGRSDAVIEWLLPGGRWEGDEYAARNPKRSDSRTGSFKINRKNGKWADFATSDKGRDLISLVAYVHGSGQGEAARQLADYLGIETGRDFRHAGPTSLSRPETESGPPRPARASNFEPRTPSSAATKEILDRHWRGRRPSAIYSYQDANGGVQFYGRRFEWTTKEGRSDKAVIPFSYGILNGAEDWHDKGSEGPYPLYGLAALIRVVERPVIVVEGEKTADAVRSIFADCLVTTSCGGSKKAHQSDWGPLKDRDVLIFPDHDESGRGYARDVARLAHEAGAKSVKILNLRKAFPDIELPKGWDLADPIDGQPILKKKAADLLDDVRVWDKVEAADVVEVPSDDREAALTTADELVRTLECDIETADLERANALLDCCLKDELIDALAVVSQNNSARISRLTRSLNSKGVSRRDCDELGRDIRARVKRIARNRGESKHHTRSGTTLPYGVSNGRLCVAKYDLQGFSMPVDLCNFAAHIDAEVIRDDGAECARFYEIETVLADGRPLPRSTIPTRELASTGWVEENLGGSAIVHGLPLAAIHLAAAIKYNSAGIKTRHLYAHTGWRKVNGKCVYLSNQAVIGSGGSVEDVEVDLAGALEYAKLCDPPIGDELRSAVRASLSALDVAPMRVTAPLLGTAYGAPLGFANFSLFLAGTTGVRKTALAALAQQHFGASTDGDRLPASWNSTDNVLQAVAFQCKDGLLVIDDLKATGDRYKDQQLFAKADRVLRGQANRADRQRMRQCAGSAGTGERALRVSVDAALRAGIFKASGSFDPMGFWDERER